MIDYTEAQGIIGNTFTQLNLSAEKVPLLSSVNRILAEDIVADTNLPPFTASSVDGYAIRFTPGQNQWTVIGEITAGHFRELGLDERSAIRIMTGGKIVSHADAVIAMEDVRWEDGQITLKPGTVLKKGLNLRHQGEDLLKGTVALQQYTRIRSHSVALLAACGKDHPLVFRRLRMGVLGTGDELIAISSMPREDKIRATNFYSLSAAAQDTQLEAVNMGVAKDTPTALRQKISKALQEENLDILLTTGGVSVGKQDYVQSVLKELGVTILFWRVNIRPGKPLLFGIYRHQQKIIPIFGLPGNPVSAYVGFILFIKPQIEKLFHQEEVQPVSAVLQESIRKTDPKRHFLRGRMSYHSSENKFVVCSVGRQSSGDMATLSQANCLICIGEDRNLVEKGQAVECIPI